MRFFKKKQRIPKPTPSKVFTGHTFQKTHVKQAYSELNTAKDNLKNSKKPSSTAKKLDLPSLLTKLQAYKDFTVLHTKLLFTRGAIARSVLEFMSRTLAVIVALTVIYLAFFDSVFLTKNYSISLTNNSYLSYETVQSVITNIQSDRSLGIFPTASYWFATSEQLTQVAKRTNPEVSSVIVTERLWPDQLHLTVSTSPTLATIIYNNKSYIVSQSGEVLGKDSISLATNPIILKTATKPSEFLTTAMLRKNDQSLLNKIFFATKISLILNDIGIPSTSLTIASDLPSDTNITIRVNKSTLYFSVTGLSEENLSTRLHKLLVGTTIQQAIQAEKISYIDLRFPKNIFVCFTDSDCSRTL